MPSALLVIDVQCIYTDPDSEMKCEDCDATIERVNRLVSAFGERKAPVLFVRHVHKQDGSDLGRLFDFTGDEVEDFNFKEGTEEVEYDERLTCPSDANEIIKNRYSAFAGTDLHERLQAMEVNRVVICGFMTNFCCASTARQALDLDYFVDFVIDATGTPGTENMDEEEIRRVVGEMLAEGFACVMSTDEYLEA